jgi:hypothetical protein
MIPVQEAAPEEAERTRAEGAERIAGAASSAPATAAGEAASAMAAADAAAEADEPEPESTVGDRGADCSDRKVLTTAAIVGRCCGSNCRQFLQTNRARVKMEGKPQARLTE